MNKISREEEIDALCDEFEADLKAGQKPVIEKYAQKLGEEHRPRLNSELLQIELWHHKHSRQNLDRDAWVHRFPELAHVIDKVIASQSGAQQKPEKTSEDTFRPNAEDQTDEMLTGSRFGRYRMDRQLGQGAMGRVYLAHDTTLDRKVALKIPVVNIVKQGTFISRFQREAQSAASLHHPGICPVYDVGEINGQPFMTMAFVNGQPLSRFVGSQGIDSQQIVDFIEKIAIAVGHAHNQDIVHRDLKPGNVLVDQQGQPIVTDFGLAFRMGQEDESRLTQDGEVMGSPGYMSPEQVHGELNKIGPATDIYALGVILYEMLTGQRPFRGSIGAIFAQITRDDPPHPRELNPNANPGLSRLALQMMSKAIEERPGSMQEVVEKLNQWKANPNAVSEHESQQENKRQKLEQKKEEIEELIKRGQFPMAIQQLEKIAQLTDQNLVDFAQWAQQEIPHVQAMPGKLKKRIPSLYQAAKQQYRIRDYRQAAELLQKIPYDYRPAKVQKLLDKALEYQDEVNLLLRDLKTCVRQKQLDGIEENLDRLLELKPGNTFAQDLKPKLESYQRIAPGKRRHRFDEHGELLPAPQGFALDVDPKLLATSAVIFFMLLMYVSVELYTWSAASFQAKPVVESAPDQPPELQAVLEPPQVVAEDIQPNKVPSNEASPLASTDSNVGQTGIDAVPGMQSKPARTGQDVPITNSIGMQLVPIPAGEFTMGSRDGDDDEKPPHRVIISKAFYLQSTEVTQSQWTIVMGTEPWQGKVYIKEGSSYPATFISWDEVVEFCNKLSQLERKTYRLPTEAEWEYACRAGTTTKYSFGDDFSQLGDFAWYVENTWDIDERFTHETGRKRANPWGLYDLHGSVFEWCSDWYADDYYFSSAARDPNGPGSGSSRVLRGGSWVSLAVGARSSNRSNDAPVSRGSLVGFRVVCE